MKDILIFKGEENISMLRDIAAFRVDVWSRLIDSEVASARFGIDQFDYEGWQFVHLHGGNIIASGRLVVAAKEAQVPDLCSFKPYVQYMTFPLGILNRLTVHWGHSGKRLGSQLNLERIDLAARQGVSVLWVEVQTYRVPSMERLGFKDMGPSQDKTIDGDWRIMCKYT